MRLTIQGFHIPPEFHALVYAALGRELHHGEGCDIQLMVEGKVFQVRMNNIDFDRDKLAELGIGMSDASTAVRNLITGSLLSYYREDGD